MSAFWEAYGFNLEGFYITSISVDESTPLGATIAEAMGRQSAQTIGGYSWQQSKAFEVAEGAVAGANRGGSGILGALLVTGMMGGTGAAGMGVLACYSPALPGFPQLARIRPGSSGARLHREVFCSNCAKRYSIQRSSVRTVATLMSMPQLWRRQR